MSESSQHVMQRSVMACGGGGMRNGYYHCTRVAIPWRRLDVLSRPGFKPGALFPILFSGFISTLWVSFMFLLASVLEIGGQSLLQQSCNL